MLQVPSLADLRMLVFNLCTWHPEVGGMMIGYEAVLAMDWDDFMAALEHQHKLHEAARRAHQQAAARARRR